MSAATAPIGRIRRLRPRIRSITPADGSWWLVTKVPHTILASRRRQRVIAWALIEITDEMLGDYTYDALEPMTEGLDFRAELYSEGLSSKRLEESEPYLWHDGDSVCDCGADPSDCELFMPSDPLWCERCAGVVTR
jgi:hypothetical protein